VSATCNNPIRLNPLREDEENVETVDQDPGERQKRNQGEEREDPLAA